jgi:hypothetical protein
MAADNLIINAGDILNTAGYDITLTDYLTINGTGTLNATSGAGGDSIITLSGNWTNSGTFTAGNSEVIFNDSSKTSVISGNTAFYKFTCTTGDKTLSFASGSTQTINNALTITGTSGHLIILSRNGGSGLNQWNIAPNGSRTVSYVNVSNSNNTVLPIINPSNSTDGNNNTNWFPAGYAISGDVYSDRGSALIGSGVNIVLVINGAVNTSVNTTGTGQYSFSNILLSAGDAILLYINDHATDGNTVTLTLAADITGLDIYGATLIVRHENAGPVTNASLNTAKGGLTDSDIIYSVSGSDLTVTSANGLLVWQNMSYTPGGNASCNDLIIRSGSTYTAGSSTITVSGHYVNAGTFTAGSSTVVFNGGSTQTLASGGTGAGKSFNNVTVSGSTLQFITNPVQIGGTLSIETGKVVDLNGQAATIATDRKSVV